MVERDSAVVRRDSLISQTAFPCAPPQSDPFLPEQLSRHTAMDDPAGGSTCYDFDTVVTAADTLIKLSSVFSSPAKRGGLIGPQADSRHRELIKSTPRPFKSPIKTPPQQASSMLTSDSDTDSLVMEARIADVKSRLQLNCASVSVTPTAVCQPLEFETGDSETGRRIIILKKPLHRSASDNAPFVLYDSTLYINAAHSEDNVDDLYTPKYTRGRGVSKEGLCPYCIRFLSLKNSAYSQHMCFVHGISPSTKSLNPWLVLSKDDADGYLVGLCRCGEWIDLEYRSKFKVRAINTTRFKKHCEDHNGKSSYLKPRKSRGKRS